MTAFIYVPLLAFTWVFAFGLAVYVAHCFLVVLEGTAVGTEEVVWPDEPMFDWLWQVFYLAWLAGAWAAPSLILVRMLTLDYGTGPWLVAVGGGLFWLLAPIGLLSSLGGGTPWLPLSLGLFPRLAQRPKATFLFYLLSAPVVAAGTAGVYYGLARADVPALGRLLAGAVAAAALLLYARLMGRLGFVLSFTAGPGERRRKRRRNRRPRERAVAVTDPWAAPEGEPEPEPAAEAAPRRQPSEMEPIQTPFEGPVSGYDVVFEDRPRPAEPPPRPARTVPDEDEGEPLAMAEDELDLEAPPPERPPVEARPEDVAALLREEPEEPANPWGATVVTFFWQAKPFQAWTKLALGFGLLGILLQALRELRPS